MGMYLLHRNSNYTEDFGAPITIRQHDTGTDTERKFAANGTVTDYPFVRYTSVLTFDLTDANGGSSGRGLDLEQ